LECVLFKGLSVLFLIFHEGFNFVDELVSSGDEEILDNVIGSADIDLSILD
jgi:hypothetical protein